MPQAFVMMHIGDKELDGVCNEAIFPAIHAAKLEPRRVDRHNSGGLLKGEIVKFIQESDILIADLTNERPNVYLEVGYAMGLDRFHNLILTVREDHFPESANYRQGGPKVHFDLAGYDILRWTRDGLDRFRNDLELRIKRRLAIVRPGPTGAPPAVWDVNWIDAQRAVTEDGMKRLGRNGHMEVRAAVHPPKPERNQSELNAAARDSQIETFGWPIAVYLDTDTFRPKPKADGIAATVTRDTNESYDHWYIRKDGDFYFLCSLFEDERPRGQSGQFLYFDTRINRVTETLLYLLRLYSRLGVDRSSKVSIAVRHSGLRGRSFTSSGHAFMRPRRASDEDSVEAQITSSLDEIEHQLIDRVTELCAPLFRVFDFAEIDRPIYEKIVNGFVAGKIV